MQRQDFNDNWIYNMRGKSDQKVVTIPHDAQIHQKRTPDAPGGGHGYFPGGIYEYEKKFVVPEDWHEKVILLEFEGIYKNSTIMYETFDMWYNRKNKYDYGCDFNEWWEQDTKAIVERDYNHPSVILYSIGNKAEVEVYADAAFVELFLNGKSMGKKKIKDFKAMFTIKYAPSTLTAVSYDTGKREISRNELQSATGTLYLRAEPEQTCVKGGEIVYIPISLVGENGELLAFGSANSCTEECYDSGSFTTYYGRALAVVQFNRTGTVTFTDGTRKESTTVTVK